MRFKSPLYFEKGRGSPHPALTYTPPPPTLSASLLMLWPGPRRIRWVGQEVKSLRLCVVVCSST